MDIALLLFAVFYALSGFMCAYNWDIMWLDTVVLLPAYFAGSGKIGRRKEDDALLCGNTGGFDSFKLLYFHYGLHLSGALFCDSDIRIRKSGIGKAILKFATGSIWQAVWEQY